jgi:hypothetical protein
MSDLAIATDVAPEHTDDIALMHSISPKNRGGANLDQT